MEEPGRLQSMGPLESDTTEQLPFHFSLSCIGEGNGNPLQCSSLDNPRDGKPGGLPSMGSHRVGHDWSDLAAAAVAASPCIPLWQDKHPTASNLLSAYHCKCLRLLYLPPYPQFLSSMKTTLMCHTPHTASLEVTKEVCLSLLKSYWTFLVFISQANHFFILL